MNLLIPYLLIIKPIQSFDSNSKMDHPFFADHLSEIHQADTLYDSRLSSNHFEQENWYHQHRNYTKSILSNWGMQVGELPYSLDNEITLRCLSELIGYRQKDLIFRSRTKQDMNALQFQRDKFRSYMQQAQRAVEEHSKKIGRLENQNAQLKAKAKKTQTNGKKQRDQDRKMIAMLRAKNEQILHQMKKKQQQSNRFKELMKKNVGQKTPSKNSFQVFLNLSLKPSKDGPGADKYSFLLDRNERELSLAVKQNGLMREKLFQIRQSLLQFNKWVDRQLFGEDNDSQRKYYHKFYLNHNLVFKKESLTQELDELLQTTKDGILQLRQICRNNQSPVKLRTPQRNQQAPELNFKKKSSTKLGPSTDRNRNQQRQNKSKPSISKRIDSASQNITPKSSKYSGSEADVRLQNKNTPKQTQQRKIGSLVVIPKSLTTKTEKIISRKEDQEELLSDLSDGHDSSIISHISIEQMGKSRFDKWDILYQDDGQ